MKPTIDEILQWAEKAYPYDKWNSAQLDRLESFAALAFVAGAAAMKERAAKECEIEAAVAVVNAHEEYQAGREMGATVCAAAIRALGDDDE